MHPSIAIDDFRATRLARILEGFSSKSPLFTVLHCPRAHSIRFGEIFSLMFWHFSWFSSSGQCSRDHQIWASLTLKSLPALILGFPGRNAADDPSRSSCIKARLQLAERGRWELLFDDYSERREQCKSSDDEPRASRPSTDSKLALFKAACKKVAGNCLRSAVQILSGSGQPPPCLDTLRKVQNLFIEPNDDIPDYIILLNTIASRDYSTSIPLKSVTRRVLNSRNGAQPGPSSTRNSHIKMCLRTNLGAEALQAWANLWACASLPEHMAKAFLDGWVAPLFKPNLSIRPIALFETTLKLATGSLLEVSSKAISKKIFPHQFGAGTPAGAEAMLRMSQALARAFPHYVMIGTDVKNAFGTLHRASILQAIAEVSPDLLPVLLALWRSGPTTMFVQISEEQWERFFVGDGLFQGECLSTAIFCLCMNTVIKLFVNSLPLEIRKCITILAYVDDVMLHMPPEHVPVVWPLWCAALKKVGLVVEVSKCTSWIPAALVISPELHSIASESSGHKAPWQRSV